MFDQIFGNYLVSANKLTKEQLEEVISLEKTVRVKMGLLAVAEKMMTKEQADEINQLQAIRDKRFGDLAVEKGYLTDEQIGVLLKKQGNIYMLFVQTVIDKGYMTLDEIENALGQYQTENALTRSDMDDMISGDVDRTVRIFLPAGSSEYYDRVCGLAIRTVIRLISSGAYVKKAYFTDELKSDRFAVQKVEGDMTLYTGFAGEGNNLLTIADSYAKEEFGTVDLDALDSVGEFVNCINGLFASELSCENVNIDMLPPEFFDHEVTLKGEQFCVFPIVIDDKSVDFVLSIDSDFSID
ncbi:MAG: chemotaxis protein CheX [Lachnospiraceae bacterium]|nr:chemotaxis protein CheX [Lachnospiraceae bacterium]